MLCSCYPNAKAIQSRVRKQNNCPSFGTKSMLSRIPTEQTWLVSSYTVNIKYPLWTADCGLRTADYGLGMKHRLKYKTQTKRYRLGIERTQTQV